MISIHILATVDENTKTYQLEAFILILHQILITNLQEIVEQQDERINNPISGVEGLILSLTVTNSHFFLTVFKCCIKY